jgi:hypothetical protein
MWSAIQILNLEDSDGNSEAKDGDSKSIELELEWYLMLKHTNVDHRLVEWWMVRACEAYLQWLAHSKLSPYDLAARAVVSNALHGGNGLSSDSSICCSMRESFLILGTDHHQAPQLHQAGPHGGAAIG